VFNLNRRCDHRARYATESESDKYEGWKKSARFDDLSLLSPRLSLEKKIAREPLCGDDTEDAIAGRELSETAESKGTHHAEDNMNAHTFLQLSCPESRICFKVEAVTRTERASEGKSKISSLTGHTNGVALSWNIPKLCANPPMPRLPGSYLDLDR
jgi:hypothetical protein